MQLWNLTDTVLHWHVKYEATKLLEGSMAFQKATCEPAGKTKKKKHHDV
jgi:hypothetical protein